MINQIFFFHGSPETLLIYALAFLIVGGLFWLIGSIGIPTLNKFNCPHCGKLFTATKDQHEGNCPRCNKHLTLKH